MVENNDTLIIEVLYLCNSLCNPNVIFMSLQTSDNDNRPNGTITLKQFMMKKLLLVFALICTSTVFISAQKDETIFGRNGIKLTGAWGGYMQNISTFENDFSLSNNSFFVFEFNKKVQIGWDGLDADFSTTSLGNLNIKSNGFTFGYSPLAHKALHPVINLYGGKGKITEINNLDGGINDNIYVWQPSLTLEMNIFRWMKIGVDGGYRFVTESNLTGITSKELSGPYAGLKMKFGWSWGR